MIDDLASVSSRIAAWLAARHADAAPVAVSGLTRSDAGYSNVTLLGDLHWQRDGRAETLGIVLRMQPQEASVFPDCDIVRQYRVLKGLAGSAVPVPRLLGLEESAALLGGAFFVMERVGGRVPRENPPYHVEGWFHDLSESERRRHWFEGIDTVAAVARVDWRESGLGFPQPPAGTTALARQLEYYRRAVLWAESLGRPYPHLHAGYRWLVANQPADNTLALSWGDAKLGNCVFRDGRLVAALDWELATLAHPVDDLAWWLMLDESLCTGYGLPRLAGLPTRAESVARWEQASGFSARDLGYYDVFAAWRMAYVMARIGTVFTRRGWVAPEAEMDRRNGGATLLAVHAARLGF